MDQAASRFNQQVAFVNLDNLSCLVLVEASFDQRILYFALSLFYLDLWYLAFFQRRSNRFRQRLNSDIYLVVPVLGPGFHVFSFFVFWCVFFFVFFFFCFNFSPKTQKKKKEERPQKGHNKVYVTVEPLP